MIDCWYSVKPIALQTAATIQKRRMIFVSDQACSSKWWWIGAIRKTRLRNTWNEKTWISTESASITKIPPITIRSTSVFVITASAAIAPPSPSDPVSPMKIDAGNELNQRKPDARPDEARGDEREVGLPRRERDPDVGEQHDRRAAGGQPVEPVGEVDRRRRPREHQVDQDRIEVAEVDRRVDHAQVERVRQVRPARRHQPQRDRDPHRDDQLPAPLQPERALLDELHVVVGEPQRGARERHARSRRPSARRGRSAAGTAPRSR